MALVERDEDDPEYKKVPPVSIYEFKGVSLGAQIDIPEKAKNRSCTNVCCCFPVLFIFLAAFGFSFYVTTTADIRRFLNGEDECGNICGVKNTEVAREDCEPKDYTKQPIANIPDNTCIEECDDKDTGVVFNRCRPDEDKDGTYFALDTIFKSGLTALMNVVVALVLTLVVLVGFKYATACMFWFFVVLMILIKIAIIGYVLYLHSLGYAYMLLTAILLIVVLVIILVLLGILVYTGRHKLVIALIAEASAAIFQIPVLLAFPFMTLIVLLGMDAYTFYLIMITVSNSIANLEMLLMFWALWIVAMILMHTFMTGFQCMVIAGSVATYYFTKYRNCFVDVALLICVLRDKQQVGNTAFTDSFYVTIRYHLGTIAAGSMIITILEIIRAIAKSARRQVHHSSAAVVVCYYCLLCCISCLEEIAEYLAKKAYMVTAMHGKGLLDSGRRALRLIWYFLLDLVMVDTFAYSVISTASLVVFLAAIGIGLLVSWSNLSSYFIYVLVLGAHLITTVLFYYFALLNISIETMFLCFCEDKLMNDGSTNRPYYMTKNLSAVMANCTDVAIGKLNKRREARLQRQREAQQ